MIDKDTWNMILGKAGKLPGTLAPEIVELAKKNNLEFYDGDPQDAFPDQLDEYRKEMKENNWDFGQDDEELFELAMHDRQYRDYKSGIAKERFNKELEAAKEKANAPIVVVRPVVEMPKIDVEKVLEEFPNAKPIHAPFKGEVIWQYDVDDKSTAPTIGTKFKEGDKVCFVQAYYGLEAVEAPFDGKIVAVFAKQGDKVQKDEILGFISK